MKAIKGLDLRCLGLGFSPLTRVYSEPEDVVFLRKPCYKLTSILTASGCCRFPRGDWDSLFESSSTRHIRGQSQQLCSNTDRKTHRKLRSGRERSAGEEAEKTKLFSWDNKCFSSTHLPLFFSVNNSGSRVLPRTRALISPSTSPGRWVLRTELNLVTLVQH